MDILKIRRFFSNALFCAVVVFSFGMITILRLPATNAIYKEFLTGVMVLCTFYINRYVLYPRYYLKGRYNPYFFCVLLVVVFATVAEFAMVYPDMEAVLTTTTSSPEVVRQSHVVYFFLILCRNAAVYLFSSVLCNYIHLKQLNEAFESRLKEKNDEIFAYYNEKNEPISDEGTMSKTHPIFEVHANAADTHNKLIEGIVFFKIEDILFFEQLKTTTFLHTVNDRILIRNSSLTKIMALVEEDKVIRISRDTVVIKKHVIGSDVREIHLLNPITKKVVNLKWSSKYRKEALPIMEQILETIRQSVEVFEDVNKRNVPIILQDEKVNKVYFYICNHDMCKASELSKNLTYSSPTVNRILAQLKKEGLIEYVGSKKTGGYRVV